MNNFGWNFQERMHLRVCSALFYESNFIIRDMVITDIRRTSLHYVN